LIVLSLNKEMGAEGGHKDKSGRAPMTIIGDAIHAETIKKELRTFRLNESFVMSPTALKSMKYILC
jgi:hypothetical protein